MKKKRVVSLFSSREYRDATMLSARSQPAEEVVVACPSRPPLLFADIPASLSAATPGVRVSGTI